MQKWNEDSFLINPRKKTKVVKFAHEWVITGGRDIFGENSWEKPHCSSCVTAPGNGKFEFRFQAFKHTFNGKEFLSIQMTASKLPPDNEDVNISCKCGIFILGYKEHSKLLIMNNLFALRNKSKLCNLLESSLIHEKEGYTPLKNLKLRFEIKMKANKKYFTHFKPIEKKFPLISNNTSNGTAPFGKLKLTWTIKNANQLLSNGENLSSQAPCFIQSSDFPTNEETENYAKLFYLRFYPKGYKRDNGFVAIGLWNNSNEEITVHSKIWLQVKDESLYSKENSAFIYSKEGQVHSKFISLTNFEERELFQENNLIIVCEINYMLNRKLTDNSNPITGQEIQCSAISDACENVVNFFRIEFYVKKFNFHLNKDFNRSPIKSEKYILLAKNRNDLDQKYFYAQVRFDDDNEDFLSAHINFNVSSIDETTVQNRFSMIDNKEDIVFVKVNQNDYSNFINTKKCGFRKYIDKNGLRKLCSKNFLQDETFRFVMEVWLLKKNAIPKNEENTSSCNVSSVEEEEALPTQTLVSALTAANVSTLGASNLPFRNAYITLIQKSENVIVASGGEMTTGQIEMNSSITESRQHTCTIL